MVNMNIPPHLEDKIFRIQFDSMDRISKIVSFFPFSESERREVSFILNNKYFDGFYSIFTDNITEQEWNKTKEQIKKKFRDELFDIDQLRKH